MPRQGNFSIPACTRFAATWDRMAEKVREVFPAAPAPPVGGREGVLAAVEANRIDDAYNSLAIEGYEVTPSLVQRVADPEWDPAQHADEDRPHALAVRGYLNAFGLVKDTLAGEMSGRVIVENYEGWYQALFMPLLESHGLRRGDIMGYRRHMVVLSTSRHVPSAWEAVPDLMRVYREKLSAETSPEVQAVLGHFAFGYIHPYQDGNGRTSRFIMNAALVAGGHPWTVIRMENRAEYLKALDAASIDENIEPFSRFVQKEMAASSQTTKLPEVPHVSRTHIAGCDDKRVDSRSLG